VGAQDAVSTGWPVEERCVGEPTKPPEGWTFPGAILMTGHYGIHAVSADVPTPYVVAFIRRDQMLLSFDVTLSPDGRWVSLVEGRYHNTTDLYNTPYATGYYYVTGIRVYNTIGKRESHRVAWESVLDYRGGGQTYPVPIPFWLDNETIVFQGKTINPFTGAISPDANRFFDIQQEGTEGNIYPAPDWSRRVVVYVGGDIGEAGGWLEDTTQNNINHIKLFIAAMVEWSSDSANFVAEIPATDQTESNGFRPPRLALFDRDGNLVDILFDLHTLADDVYGIATFNGWNPNQRYFAFFTLNRYGDLEPHLFIADFQSGKVIDTCLNVDSRLAWSPDGKLLAVLKEYEHRVEVQVLDMETWGLYTVAYHDRIGRIIGWREDQ
jgi:hypothetical protein